MNIRFRSVALFWGAVMVLAVGLLDCRGYFEKAVFDFHRERIAGVKGDGPFVDASRILVRKHVSRDECVWLVTGADGILSAIDRTLAEALAWELGPERVRLGDHQCQVPVVVVGPTRNKRRVRHQLSASGYACIEEMSGTGIWRRGPSDNRKGCGRQGIISGLDGVVAVVLLFVVLSAYLAGGMALVGAEIIGLSLLSFVIIASGLGGGARSVLCWIAIHALLLVNGWAWLRSSRQTLSVKEVVSGASVFILCASIALMTDLPANCGLGVWGGKARLWWTGESGLFLAGGSSYTVLQPSYPPLWPCLVWFYSALAGGASDCYVQILPPLFCALIASSMVARCKDRALAFLVCSLFVCEPMLTVAVNFYAEPLMVLVALAGLELVERDRVWLGFSMIGCCGLIKHEGIVIAGLLGVGLALLLCKNDRLKGAFPFALVMLAIFGPGLMWSVASRLSGCVPQDFASVLSPDGTRALGALKVGLDITLLHPWRMGWIYPAAVLLACCNPRRYLAPAVLLFLAFLVFVYVLSLSLAPDFEWHCHCLTRLLWSPAVLFVAVALSSQERRTGGLPSCIRQI